MRELHIEGVAIHDDPESCVGTGDLYSDAQEQTPVMSMAPSDLGLKTKVFWRQ